MKALEILKAINSNEELRKLELEGFERGEAKGKTLEVSIHTIMRSVIKQYNDLLWAYHKCLGSFTLKHVEECEKELGRCIADLRNVAGCLFLKLIEKEKQK